MTKKIDPDHDKKMQEGQAYQFLCMVTWPSSWKDMASTLKHAADRLLDHHVDGIEKGEESFAKFGEEASRHVGTEPYQRELTDEEMIASRDRDLIAVYYLLSGYAIENLLKGILMMQNPEYFTPDKKLVKFKSHDLVDLCNRCGIAITDDERLLLTKLARHIEWEGKYPAPLDVKKAPPRKLADGTWDTSCESLRGRETQEEIDKLYNRVLNEAERIEDLLYE